MELMGILNITPDSFSDGGHYFDTDAAIQRGLELIAQGASIIDIGGESTRPGAAPVSPEEEWQRTGAAVKALSEKVVVSVDTYHAATARAAVAAGASIVNDVTGGSDPNMFASVAELGCDYVLQHGRGNAQTMNDMATYDDVVYEVYSELMARRDAAVAAGIEADRIILDPGIGFAKLGEDNWKLLQNLETFLSGGHRLLIGHSRKRFLEPTIINADRDTPTAVLSVLLAQRGVWAVRVHNVGATSSALAAAQLLSDIPEQP